MEIHQQQEFIAVWFILMIVGLRCIVPVTLYSWVHDHSLVVENHHIWWRFVGVAWKPIALAFTRRWREQFPFKWNLFPNPTICGIEPSRYYAVTQLITLFIEDIWGTSPIDYDDLSGNDFKLHQLCKNMVPAKLPVVPLVVLRGAQASPSQTTITGLFIRLRLPHGPDY